MDKFLKDLTQLCNFHSIDTNTDTPDYLLAKFIVRVIDAYEGLMDDIKDVKTQTK